MTKNKHEKKFTYLWEGTNASSDILYGEMQAKNKTMAKVQLIQMKIAIKKIRKKSFIFKNKKLTLKQYAFFTNQLIMFLKSGLQVESSIQYIIKNSRDNNLHQMLNFTKNALNNGMSFAESLSESNFFDHFYCNLISIGEQTGHLEKILTAILNVLDKQIQFSNKIKKMIAYPLFLIISSMLMVFSILYYIFPSFINLFNELSTPLPFSTKVLISCINFIRDYFFILITLPVTGIIMTKKIKNPLIVRIYEIIQSKLPLIGRLIKLKFMSDFSQTLSICLASGLTVKNSFPLIQTRITHHVFKNGLEKVEFYLNQGHSLSQSIENTNLFTPFLIQLIQLGESTSQLEWSLNKCHEHYEQIIENLLDHFTNLIEPLLMLILGIMIAAIIIAMYQPLFNIGNLNL
ncbi:MAG: type II secretion system F family protein [Gammaproteobacteria bacterium]